MNISADCFTKSSALTKSSASHSVAHSQSAIIATETENGMAHGRAVPRAYWHWMAALTNGSTSAHIDQMHTTETSAMDTDSVLNTTSRDVVDSTDIKSNDRSACIATTWRRTEQQRRVQWLRRLRTTMVSLICVGIVVHATAVAAQTFDDTNIDLAVVQADRLASGAMYFPRMVSQNNTVAVVFQEIEVLSANRGTITLAVAVYRQGSWDVLRNITEPVDFYRDAPPDIFSVTWTQNDTLLIAYIDGADSIIFHEVSTANNAITHRRLQTIELQATTAAPNLFSRSDGSILCIINSLDTASNRFIQRFAISVNGVNWSSFRPLSATSTSVSNVAPTYASIGNKEFVVYQNLITSATSSTYQLFITSSNNGGSRWSNPRQITSFTFAGENQPANRYDNQSPTLVTRGEMLHLAWEREAPASEEQIVYATLNADGNIVNDPVIISALGETAKKPSMISHPRGLFMTWAVSRGERRIVYFARRGLSGVWQSNPVSGGAIVQFANIVNTIDNDIYVSWLQSLSGNQSAVEAVRLASDSNIVTIDGANFNIDRPSRQKLPEFRWRINDNQSSIGGFYYSWSQNRSATELLQDRLLAPSTQSVTLIADSDGDWYFTLTPIDTLGNPFEQQVIRYVYDTSAPAGPQIVYPPIDSEGFAQSNTFTIEWDSGEGQTDVAGYYAVLRRIGNTNVSLENENPLSTIVPTESVNITTTNTSLRVRNLDNGRWRFSLAAIDYAGNSSGVQQGYLLLNKYRPETLIYNINITDGGNISSFTINGRGFATEGRVTACIVDSDGQEPYDYYAESTDSECIVTGDAAVTQISLQRLRSGEYFVGLEHSRRGVTFSNSTFELLPSGVVLFGNFLSTPTNEIVSVSYQHNRLLALTDGSVGYYLLLILLIGISIVLLILVITTLRASKAFKQEISLLEQDVNNRYTIGEQMKRMGSLRIKGVGLRIKFTLFITLLVVSVILTISLVLGSNSLQRQERILANGLQQRVEVLIDSIATQAALAFLNPANKAVGLGSLTIQSDVLSEAQYVTITGLSRDEQGHNAVWVTNDDNILNVEQSGGQQLQLISTQAFEAGDSYLNDVIAEGIPTIRDTINAALIADLGTLPSDIIDTSQQIKNAVQQSVVATGANKTALDEELAQLDALLIELNSQLNATIRENNAATFSYPEFNAGLLNRENTNYIFYRPVVGWDIQQVGLEDNFYQGMVRLGISTDLLVEELNVARSELIFTTLIIAIVAMVIGFIGSSLLATVVVSPINRVVQGVEVISGTEDKSELKGHAISVRSRDEISLLAERVNDMTEGLVKASEANKELIVGKEVQKLFIPLQKDAEGKKQSVAKDTFGCIDIAGYYEGAHGVSGDYFTYNTIDNDHLAVIKCDVSGKGVPAALIMVEVATIFTDFINNRTTAYSPDLLVQLLTRINDILESMQFQGRFAALLVAIINTKTGHADIGHAGDNQVHIYRAKKREVEVVNLPQTPAAGIFPSTMLPNGYQRHATQLEAGDCLLLFTDGLEESRRYLRDNTLAIIPEKKHDAASTTSESDRVGGTSETNVEEFGLDRIHAIMSAIMSGATYTLTRKHEPQTDVPSIDFNFSNSDRSVSAIVNGIVAIEKIFRMYIINDDNQATAEGEGFIEIDAQIMPTLRQTFKQYETYFQHRIPTNTPDYERFSKLMEEVQYDDLTFVALMRSGSNAQK